MKNRWYKVVFLVAAVVVLAVVLRTCGFGGNLTNSEPAEQIDAELTLQTVTLEQPDEDGNLMWRIKAETVNYIPDTEKAELLNLEGEFFQSGEVVYTVIADEGEVRQNGETLFLRGNLVATGDALILEGERLKWQPKDDLLVMGDFSDDESVNDSFVEEGGADDGDAADAADVFGREPFLEDDDQLDADNPPVKGFNDQLEAIARRVTVQNKDNRVDLSGGVIAKSKEAPWVSFESDALTWFTQREVIQTDQPLKVEQFDGEAYETVTDRLVGMSGKAQLEEKQVTLEDSVQLDALTQPLTVNSERAVWDLEAELITLDRPVDIVQPERRVSAIADSARVELATQTVYLLGNVRAVGEENDARLAADALTWQTESQQVEADGNVRYQQAANPEVSMAGNRAVGNIDAGTVVVTGGETGEVVTEIVPEGF
ncbi:MAG: LPS export ABC transporter periplasmic protein LptC [Cyanobacteria bacterium J06573_11]